MGDINGLFLSLCFFCPSLQNILAAFRLEAPEDCTWSGPLDPRSDSQTVSVQPHILYLTKKAAGKKKTFL